jgi:hypothetical protein
MGRILSDKSLNGPDRIGGERDQRHRAGSAGAR